MTDMEHILCQVEANMTTPEFKARLFALLARMGLYRVPRSHLIHYRAEAAVKLINSGIGRAAARDALRETFGISRASAYRLLHRALDMRQGRLFE